MEVGDVAGEKRSHNVDDHLRIFRKTHKHPPCSVNTRWIHSLRHALPKSSKGAKKRQGKFARPSGGRAKPLSSIKSGTAAIVTRLLWGLEGVWLHLLRGLVLGAGRRVGGVLGLGLGLRRCGGSLARRLSLGGSPESL